MPVEDINSNNFNPKSNAQIGNITEETSEGLYIIGRNILQGLKEKIKGIPNDLTNKIITIKYEKTEIVLDEHGIKLFNSDGEELYLEKKGKREESLASSKNGKRQPFKKEKFIQGFCDVYKHADKCEIIVKELDNPKH